MEALELPKTFLRIYFSAIKFYLQINFLEEMRAKVLHEKDNRRGCEEKGHLAEFGGVIDKLKKKTLGHAKKNSHFHRECSA